ncbi:MAG: hypothetical protein CL847_01875 [Crocinitomicaceae bacterium]|nr:hypothetical protein [Crocinitomicaceae bacterium]
MLKPNKNDPITTVGTYLFNLDLKLAVNLPKNTPPTCASNDAMNPQFGKLITKSSNKYGS